MAHDILIIDDEADICMTIAGVLKDEGYATREATDTAQALAAIDARQPTLVILDLWLYGDKPLEGFEILKRLRAEMPSVPVVIISGHGTIETAVEAIKIGAYDFVEKPFKSDRLLLVVERAIEAAQLRRENEELKLRAGGDIDFIGISPGANLVRQQIEKAAPTGSRVLVTGPPGAGKEVIGRLLHLRSRRDEGTVRAGQLRHDAARAARNRTVRHRSRERRRTAQDRHLRTRAWRHPVSRRSRRHADRDPRQDRPRAARADF